ncbi:MAG: DUF2244 domain-containing protein [Alphaproteobacteria bacterium]
MDDGKDQIAGEYLLDAVLSPHRSLSPRGFLVLMGCIAAVSFAVGIAFAIAGAWPIFGFFGLDVALIYWTFRANYRSGRAHERLRLTRDELRVERTDASGNVRRWTFQPYWLKVEIDDPPEHASQLVLRSHGRALAIGAFLSPPERGEVAGALRRALARCRAPSGGTSRA